MANGITITLEGFEEFKNKLGNYTQQLATQISDVLNKHALNMATRAKQNAPVNEGTLRNSISADTSNQLVKFITVNAPYAAFVEFGTGRFAAEYVASLPEDWQTFAAQFEGQHGGGSFADFVIKIKEWLRLKGIDVFADREQQFDAESGQVIVRTPRKHTKDQHEAALDQAAYLIARKIVTEGMRAQPYLYPAFVDTVPELLADVRQLFK